MSATPHKDLQARILEAAIDLAQTRQWATLTLIEIAKHADIPMADLYGVTDKNSLCDALEPWSDQAMSAEAADMEDTPRERLFDVIMNKFEHMEPHRSGLLSIMQARDRSPRRIGALLKARKASAEWALCCAGLDSYGSGTERTATILGVAWVIGKTERAWRQDDSADFARTMATLDTELTNAEERLARLRRFSGKSHANPATDDTYANIMPEESSEPEAPQAASEPV